MTAPVDAPVVAPRTGRGVVLRRNAFASALRAGSTSLTTAVLPIVLVVVLPGATYAVWALIFSIAAFTLYFDLGVQGAVLALVGRAEAIGDRPAAVAAGRAGLRVATVVGLIAVAAGVALGASLEGVFPSIPGGLRQEAGLTLVLLFAGQGLTLVGNALSAYLGGGQRTASATAILVPARLASMVLTAVAALLGAGLVVLGIAFVVPLAVGTGVLLVRFLREGRGVPVRKGGAGARQLLRFSSTLILWNLCMLVVTGLDLTIVGRLDFAHVAVYSIASTVALGIAGLDNAVIAPVLPELSGRLSAGDAAGANDLLVRTTRMNALLLGGAVVVASAAAPVVAMVLLGSADLTLASAVIIVLVAANCLRLVVAPLSLGFVAGGTHTKLVVQPLMEMISNLVASIVLGILFGAVGVAIGTLLGALVGVVTAMTWSLHVAGRGLVRRRDLVRNALGTPLWAWSPGIVAVVIVWLLGDQGTPGGIGIEVAAIVLSVPLVLLALGPNGRAPLRRMLPARLR